MEMGKCSLYSESQLQKTLSSLFWAWIESEHLAPAKLCSRTTRARSPGLGHMFYYKSLGNGDLVKYKFKNSNFFNCETMFDLMTEQAAADRFFLKIYSLLS